LHIPLSVAVALLVKKQKAIGQSDAQEDDLKEIDKL
jgi:hypothetical protein